ncbi:MAG: CdaR family protein [Bacilli bacterium]|nr:CdaR family protein [Bacilli bacterium]
MNKIFKIISSFFKGIYNIIDKLIVIPISRIIYRISELVKSNSGRFEKVLNRPNILIYVSLFSAIIIFLLIDTKAINLVTEEAEIISGQQVEIIYNEEAYVVEGVPETVDITLIGRKSDLYLAKQLGEHKVVLDLSGYSTGQYKVKLKYNHSVESVNYKLDPSTITIKISEKVSAIKTLNHDLLNSDKLDNKLSIKSVELDRNEVIVKGSSEALDTVTTVRALVDLKAYNLTERGTYTIDSIVLVAYDSNGNKINNVEMVPTKVSASIIVDSHYSELPVKIITTGKPTVGYAISSAISSTTKVKVYGDKEIIDELKFIEAVIDINGLNNDKIFNVTLTKPAGVRHMTETTTSVSVTMDSESSKEFDNIQVESINLGNNYIVNAESLADSAITVIAKGVTSVLSGIEQSQIKAQIDLSGYGVGTHEVPVNVFIDDIRVTLVPKVSTVKVRISS